jgi:hypothetical protein
MVAQQRNASFRHKIHEYQVANRPPRVNIQVRLTEEEKRSERLKERQLKLSGVQQTRHVLPQEASIAPSDAESLSVHEIKNLLLFKSGLLI